jgi:cytochrome P450
VSVQFNPFCDLKIADPSLRFRELRDDARVHWSPEGEIFTVSRYDDVQAVLKDSETYSSEAMQTVLNSGLMLPLTPTYIFKLLSFLFRARTNPISLLKTGNLISLDGERHTALRKIVGQGFTPRRIADWQPRIQSIVEQYVAKIRKRDRIDVIADLAIPLPTTVIAEMLGVEADRREDFKHWSSSIISVASGAAKEDVLASGVLEDITELFIYLNDVIRERRRSPQGDLISLLADPEKKAVLSEIDIIQFVILLLVAGNETTTNLIGNAVHALIDHPRQLDRVIADPSMIPNLVEETLRFDSPLAVGFRNTTRDAVLGGVTIPKGKNLTLLIGSANRDERFFENPDQFDITRDTTGHLGFGYGAHFCLGSSFARLQAQTALAALVPELNEFRRRGNPPEMIDSFLVRGRQSLELIRA